MTKRPITERALFARVNRALAREGRMLKACREDSKFFGTTGRYMIVAGNIVDAMHIDLPTLAAEMDCIKSYETILMEAA